MVANNACATILLCVLMQSSISNAEETGTCPLGEPYVREQTATLLLSHRPLTSDLFGELSSESPSVLVQLWLWAYIKQELAFDTAQALPFDVTQLIARRDDSINGLLWVIGHSREQLGAAWLHEPQLRQLTAWSIDFLRRNPRRMFLNMLVAGGITGVDLLSSSELEAINADIRDPDVITFLGGKKMAEGDSIAGHRLFLEAFENGSLPALLGLGQIEASEFPACVERGRLYTRLYISLFPVSD
jgi:hypothetical protein